MSPSAAELTVFFLAVVTGPSDQMPSNSNDKTSGRFRDNENMYKERHSPFAELLLDALSTLGFGVAVCHREVWGAVGIEPEECPELQAYFADPFVRAYCWAMLTMHLQRGLRQRQFGNILSRNIVVPLQFSPIWMRVCSMALRLLQPTNV